MTERRQTGPGAPGHDVEAAVEEIVREAVESSVRAATPERTDGPRRTGNGARRPPSGPRPHLAGPLESFLRHPFLALLPVVLLVAGAVFLGIQRDPEYTAEARINVGRADVPPFYVQSVVTGSQSLASTYAWAVVAEPVVQAAGRAVGIGPAEARRHLSASPVGGSTLIQVEATGTSASSARALANAAAGALIDYINRINANKQSASLFERYQKAQRQFRVAEERVRRLEGSSSRRPGQLRRARLAADAAELKASDLSGRYRAASLDPEENTPRLDVIAPAAQADSDRRDVLERLVVIGAIAGIVLGLALALLRSNWNLLRSLRPG